MNYYGQYGQNILGRAPGGSAFGQIQNNTTDPYVAALGGMQSGFGFGGKLGSFFGNMFNPVNQSTGTGGYGMSRTLPYTDRFGFGVG